jgi:hypothetical protein
VLQTSASLTLVVNGPPRNGYIGATPGEGVALSTAFTLIAPGWVDDDTVGCSVHPLGAVCASPSTRTPHLAPHTPHPHTWYRLLCWCGGLD